MSTMTIGSRPHAPYRATAVRGNMQIVTAHSGVHRFSLKFPDTTTEAPRTARELVRQHAPESVAFAAELAVSELVTNVARHAPGAARVCLTVTAAALVLSVTDQHPEIPVALPAAGVEPDLAGESARGLFLLVALATVTVRSDSKRKRITARFPFGETS